MTANHRTHSHQEPARAFRLPPGCAIDAMPAAAAVGGPGAGWGGGPPAMASRSAVSVPKGNAETTSAATTMQDPPCPSAGPAPGLPTLLSPLWQTPIRMVSAHAALVKHLPPGSQWAPRGPYPAAGAAPGPAGLRWPTLGCARSAIPPRSADNTFHHAFCRTL